MRAPTPLLLALLLAGCAETASCAEHPDAPGCDPWIYLLLGAHHRHWRRSLLVPLRRRPSTAPRRSAQLRPHPAALPPVRPKLLRDDYCPFNEDG